MAKTTNKVCEICGNAFYGAPSQIRKTCSWACRNKYLSGENAPYFRHGKTRSTEYNSWRAMKERCYNPGYRYYHRYGGRGITVCDKWQKFVGFYEDMGDKPTPKHEIDRIDNDSNYEPGNCRWVDGTTQRNNTSANKWIEIDGVKKTLAQWCRHYDVPIHQYYNRKVQGWETKRIFEVKSRGVGANQATYE